MSEFKMVPGDLCRWLGYKYQIIAISANFAYLAIMFKDLEGKPFIVRDVAPLHEIRPFDGLQTIRSGEH